MSKRKRYIVGKPLVAPTAIYNKYKESVLALVRQMTTELTNEILAHYKRDFMQAHFGTMDASAASQTRILLNRAKQTYGQLFGAKAMGLSTSMADAINRASATSVASSVADLNIKDESKALSIDIKKLDARTKAILRASADRSAAFIRSIPEGHIGQVADAVYSSITSGNGLQDLEDFLEKQNVRLTNWASNTALDQTRKAYNGLNAGRMKNIGIERGEWIHSGGSQHPRELHEDFDGQTFDLDKGAPVGDDDGNYVMPGDESNCRCTFAPVVPLDDESDDDSDED